MTDTLNSVVEHNKSQVINDTFGHLAPKAKQVYEGYILFTLTSFGDTCIIDFEFDGLNSSPWFNTDILDYIFKYTEKLPKTKYFGVYRFNGTYKKFKTGSYKFTGEIVEINCI